MRHVMIKRSLSINDSVKKKEKEQGPEGIVMHSRNLSRYRGTYSNTRLECPPHRKEAHPGPDT